MGVFERGDPVPQCRTDGILECLESVVYRHHLCAQEPHLFHIGHLTLNIDAPHVYTAFKTEERGRGSSCNAVLTGACFRNYASLAHTARHQRLSNRIVDLVRSCMKQIFPF